MKFEHLTIFFIALLGTSLLLILVLVNKDICPHNIDQISSIKFKKSSFTLKSSSSTNIYMPVKELSNILTLLDSFYVQNMQLNSAIKLKYTYTKDDLDIPYIDLLNLTKTSNIYNKASTLYNWNFRRDLGSNMHQSNHSGKNLLD